MFRSPTIVVRHEPAVLRPGDPMLVEVDIECSARTKVDRITIDLVANETSSLLDMVGRHFTLRVTLPGGSLAPGIHTRSALFELPADALPTRSMGSEKVEYTLLVHLHLPWRPDVERRFSIPVHPKIAPPVEVLPRTFRGSLVPVGAQEPTYEITIERLTLSPGETLSGWITVRDFAESRRLALRTELVSRVQPVRRAWPASQLEPIAPVDERFTADLHRSLPIGEPVSFQIALSPVMSLSFAGKETRRWWELVLFLSAEASVESSVRIPLEIVSPASEMPSPEAGDGEIVRLGRERRAQVWGAVAERLGLLFDAEEQEISRSIGEVSLRIGTEEGEQGTLTVARIDWPPLGIDLHIERRRLSDLLAERIETGDREMDRRFHVRGREAAQVRWLLEQGVSDFLLLFGEEALSVNDAGARLSMGGAGLDEATLEIFAHRVHGLATQVFRTHSDVPPPAALARFEPAWRAAADHLAGRLEKGRMAVVDARFQGARVELVTEWAGAGRIAGTRLRLWLDPPLPARVDVGSAGAAVLESPAFSRAALAAARSLAARVEQATFGQDALEVTLALAALDPMESVAWFEELSLVAAALQSRSQGPYR